jgi:hypothetical protein
LQDVLRHLTPQHIERLVAKHHVEPWGRESWIKWAPSDSGVEPLELLDRVAGLFCIDLKADDL